MMRKLFTLLLLAASPVRADTLIDNVNGVTLTAEGQVERFNGLLIGADGKVKALYTAKLKRPAKVDYRVDGGGKTLLPGLIDAHGHVMGLAWQSVTLDLSGTKSLAEAQAKIAAYVASNPSRRWIIGRGWNQEAWGLGRFPTAAELDSVVSGRREAKWYLH
jgi:predicted amidohydrolase YtcJ